MKLNKTRKVALVNYNKFGVNFNGFLPNQSNLFFANTRRFIIHLRSCLYFIRLKKFHIKAKCERIL